MASVLSISRGSEGDVSTSTPSEAPLAASSGPVDDATPTAAATTATTAPATTAAAATTTAAAVATAGVPSPAPAFLPSGCLPPADFFSPKLEVRLTTNRAWGLFVAQLIGAGEPVLRFWGPKQAFPTMHSVQISDTEHVDRTSPPAVPPCAPRCLRPSVTVHRLTAARACASVPQIWVQRSTRTTAASRPASSRATISLLLLET